MWRIETDHAWLTGQRPATSQNRPQKWKKILIGKGKVAPLGGGSWRLAGIFLLSAVCLSSFGAEERDGGGGGETSSPGGGHLRLPPQGFLPPWAHSLWCFLSCLVFFTVPLSGPIFGHLPDEFALRLLRSSPIAAIQLCEGGSVDGMRVNFVPIEPLPLLNTDLEVGGKYPPPVEDFRRQVLESDAVLFACPENNYSFSGTTCAFLPTVSSLRFSSFFSGFDRFFLPCFIVIGSEFLLQSKTSGLRVSASKDWSAPRGRLLLFRSLVPVLYS